MCSENEDAIDINILLVSRAINLEATDILYEKNLIVFLAGNGLYLFPLPKFIQSTKPLPQFGRMRHVMIQCSKDEMTLSMNDMDRLQSTAGCLAHRCQDLKTLEIRVFMPATEGADDGLFRGEMRDGAKMAALATALVSLQVEISIVVNVDDYTLGLGDIWEVMMTSVAQEKGRSFPKDYEFCESVWKVTRLLFRARSRLKCSTPAFRR